MADTCMIYGTVASPEEGRRIARALVQDKLVACVNLLNGATSVYHWQGAVEEATETVFIAKTTKALSGEALTRFKALHGYDVPCAVVYDMTGGLPDYLAWIMSTTGAG
ncbi:MAG: divalent-cation tolerance protein CutA [Rhodospirillaceae bacterium]|nr:divalent-cation tolerance protein CutA [Rhodospirillaceae bacterium]